MITCSNPKCNNLAKVKFCSKSCAATTNNIGRQRNKTWCDETFGNNKIHRPRCEYLRNIPRTHKNGAQISSLIKFINCSACGQLFTSHKSSNSHYIKCCSEKCKNSIRRRNSTGIKRHTYKNVLMDSLWEVRLAKFLDEHSIEWVRPQYLVWVDVNNISRHYYPDFYLPKLDLYLDPKNKFIQKLQKDKIDYINLFYNNVIIGEIDYIINELARKIGVEPT